MKEKLQILMEKEGLKSGMLAEKLGVNPAGISHLLAGRNKPSFDLLQKILRAFPRVNPDWLLLDAPNIYRSEGEALPADEVFNHAEQLVQNLFSDEASQQPKTERSHEAASTNPTLSAAPNFWPPVTDGKTPVERVVVFFVDQTFKSYTPSKG